MRQLRAVVRWMAMSSPALDAGTRQSGRAASLRLILICEHTSCGKTYRSPPKPVEAVRQLAAVMLLDTSKFFPMATCCPCLVGIQYQTVHTGWSQTLMRDVHYNQLCLTNVAPCACDHSCWFDLRSATPQQGKHIRYAIARMDCINQAVLVVADEPSNAWQQSHVSADAADCHNH